MARASENDIPDLTDEGSEDEQETSDDAMRLRYWLSVPQPEHVLTKTFLYLYFQSVPLWKLVLDHGPNVNQIDTISGRTVLVTAASRGEKDSVQLLLDHGADVDKADGDGHTALITAAWEGREETVRLLIDKGAKVNIHDTDGETALFSAAHKGHTAIVRMLLEHGADKNAINSGQRTTLYHMVEKAVFEDASNENAVEDDVIKGIVQLLLDHGADANIASYGDTALFLAACAGHTAIVQMLLHHCTDVPKRDALFAAAGEGHTSIVKTLLEHGSDKGASYAVKDVPEEIYHSILEKYEEAVLLVSTDDVDNNCSILTAKKGSRTNAVALQMLKSGVDITKYGIALSLAVAGRHRDVVQVLLGFGVGIDVNKSIALSLAAHLGDKEMVQLLLDSGADVNDAYGDGDFALMRAAWEGHEEIVELLLNNGAAVSKANNDGDTALMRAAGKGHENIVELLLNRDTEGHENIAQQEDTEGVTALFCAAACNHSKQNQETSQVGLACTITT